MPTLDRLVGEETVEVGGRRGLGIAHYLIVAAVAALCVWPALSGGFVYDDNYLIEHNRHIRDLSNAARLFSPDYFELSGERTFRPLTTLSFMADTAAWGVRARGFHVTSLLIHVLCAALVAALAGRFASPLAAVFAGVLFAAHPLGVESVAGVSFREDPLAAAFCAGSLLAFLGWRARGGAWRLAGAWALYLSALLSKESAGALPLLALAICLAGRPRLPLRKTVTAMSGYAAAAVAVGAFFFFALDGGGKLGKFPGGGPLASFPVMVETFGRYLRLFVDPSGICLEYQRSAAGWGGGGFLLSLAVLAALLVSGAAARRRLPGWSLGVAFFFTALIPISNILPFGAVMANRYMYLPMMGLCVAAGAAVSYMAGERRRNLLPAALIVCAIVYFAPASLRQARLWRNGVTLWTDAALCCPSSARAHTNLGVALIGAGRADEAVSALETAVSLDPHYEALNGLGTALMEAGRWDGAEAALERAAALRPDSPFPAYNAGLALMRKGDPAGALEWFRRTLRIDQRFTPAVYNSANVYLRAGDTATAEKFYLRALELEPDHLDAMGNLAVVYIQTGRTDEAVNRLRFILARDPGNERAAGMLKEIQKDYSE